MLTPNELVLPFGGTDVCAHFGENRSRNATVRVLADGQIHWQTHWQTQTDCIICPILCYSYGTDNNNELFGIAAKSRFDLFGCEKCQLATTAQRAMLRKSGVVVKSSKRCSYHFRFHLTPTLYSTEHGLCRHSGWICRWERRVGRCVCFFWFPLWEAAVYIYNTFRRERPHILNETDVEGKQPMLVQGKLPHSLCNRLF